MIDEGVDFVEDLSNLESRRSTMGIQVQLYVFLICKGKYFYFMLFKVLKPQRLFVNDFVETLWAVFANH
jgi:hypothetical protein